MKRILQSIVLVAASCLLAGCSGTGTGGAATVAGAGGASADYRNSTAEVVVLDFFDMYCHTCQTAASHVNELHREVGKRGAGGRVDFYAIGWGNTAMESDMYRKRFKVPFPVVPDPELAISNRFGKFRPPLMIVLRKQGGGWKEIDRVKDVRGDHEAILAKILP